MNLRALWASRWFRIVALSALAITLAILAYDAVLIAAHKPTISGVVWSFSLRSLSVPYFFGGLCGHWFLPMPQPRFLARYGAFFFFGLLAVLVTLDALVRWDFPRWVPGVACAGSFPIGALLWGLERKRSKAEMK